MLNVAVAVTAAGVAALTSAFPALSDHRLGVVPEPSLALITAVIPRGIRGDRRRLGVHRADGRVRRLRLRPRRRRPVPVPAQ
ncbi:hypothetical protein LT493_08355 [Streptomyces tricolor]|nr:hypothetical protein [Streptomyces tricolor]